MEKDELSNIDIALFALYKLGGIAKKIHTEYIAWEAYNLAPERFSWRLPEFREKGFPDKTLVRYALDDAKKKTYGSLIKGRAGGDVGGRESEGYTFTPAGTRWIKHNILRISEALKAKTPLIHPREAHRFLMKVNKDSAFLHFLKNGNLEQVSQYMFTDMLGCTPDASKEIVRRKFDRFLSVATLVGDEDVIHFLDNCKAKFSYLLEINGKSQEGE